MEDSYSIFNLKKILHSCSELSSCHLRNNHSDLSTSLPVDACHHIQITHTQKNHCPLSGLIHLVLLHTAYNLKISSNLHASCSRSSAAAHLIYLIRCRLCNGKGIGPGLIGPDDISAPIV